MSTHSLQPGMLIGGKYKLKHLLGEGGMGSVFAAENTLSGKQVAIKCMHRRIAQTPEASQRFLREARASALIRHPNVVDVYDVLAENDTFYLVMELLEGESLSAFLARETTTLPLLVNVLIGAMRGVAAAHRQGVIHRDIKPENIFLAREEDDQRAAVAKVLDFGISKLQGMEDIGLTAPGAALGTVAYMSTEQLSNAKDIDGRADVYAFGVILYQAITGRQPFPAETYAEMIMRIMTEQATPIHELRPDVPARLCAVVEAAMAKAREQRTASLEEMISGLEPFSDAIGFDQRPLLTSKLPQAGAQPLVVFSHPDPDTAAVPAVPPMAASEPECDDLPLEPVPRRGRLVPALALLGAVSAVAVMWWLVRERRDAAISDEHDGAHLVVPAPARVSVLSAAAHLPEPPHALDAIPSGSLPEDRRAAPPPHAQPRAAASHKPKPVAGSGKPAAKAGCSPNYTFDAQGEKHFKAECF